MPKSPEVPWEPPEMSPKTEMTPEEEAAQKKVSELEMRAFAEKREPIQEEETPFETLDEKFRDIDKRVEEIRRFFKMVQEMNFEAIVSFYDGVKETTKRIKKLKKEIVGGRKPESLSLEERTDVGDLDNKLKELEEMSSMLGGAEAETE